MTTIPCVAECVAQRLTDISRVLLFLLCFLVSQALQLVVFEQLSSMRAGDENRPSEQTVTRLMLTLISALAKMAARCQVRRETLLRAQLSSRRCFRLWCPA